MSISSGVKLLFVITVGVLTIVAVDQMFGTDVSQALIYISFIVVPILYVIFEEVRSRIRK